jgi:GNAT superfamily N-acetyltransferase
LWTGLAARVAKVEQSGEDDGVKIEPVSAGSVEARVLVALYVDEIAAAFPDGFDPAASVSADPDELTPPRGIFLVVRADDGNPVGCGAVKLLDPQTAEIKRMWLAPEARGQGLGTKLLDALEAAARDLGATQGRLDTRDVLDAAMTLYRKAGWEEIPAYNDNVYATHWFGKTL